eukprot:TRINITY_DN8258_c0_g1_i1.p1 TRINITY_DN8258_c0_g1~~TRINITY_DN8258_c0_g1_i1.p1  ORF type:complete len:565 (+),score=108.74 TRINITY_DN8258_c0_g1_i1:95-1696(+)
MEDDNLAHKTGSAIPYESRVSPMVDDNGVLYSWAGTPVMFRDGHNVYVNLTVDICQYNEHITFYTRCYNGDFLGPTITVRQGDVLYVYLVNNLQDETGDELENEMHWPNHTSLHFHGIHAAPHEDNPFDSVGPGENRTIIVHIEDDHYPGTHWYHAHYHGNGAYQIFGGLHGAFIIEPRNRDAFYTDFLKNMRPIVVVLSNLKMFSWDNGGWHGFVEYHDFIGDEVDLALTIDHSKYNNTFAVNGKYQPYIDIAVNEWIWLRLVNAGASLIVPLKFNSTQCQHYAIAVDGVFLEEPVDMNAYYIFPGSRLDVAVKCAEFGNHSVQFWKDPDNIWIYREVDSGEDVILFTLEADRLHDGPSMEIGSYQAPEKPAYLDDLRDYPADEIAGRYDIRSVFVSEDDDWFGFNDDVRWDGSGNSTLFSLEVGKVYEITFTTQMAVHPIHVHVNHMQIVNDTEVEWSSFSTHAMHQIGTWRDTIYSVFERNVTVRVRPDRFVGYALVHCHYVIHADRGMMAEIELIPGDLESEDDVDTED